VSASERKLIDDSEEEEEWEPAEGEHTIQEPVLFFTRYCYDQYCGLNSKTGGGGGGPCIAQYGSQNTTGRGAIKEVLKAKNSID